MIGAHLYSALFYFPEKVFEDPLYLLYFWEGISSFGGFLGGTAGVLYYFKKNRLPFWDHACVVPEGQPVLLKVVEHAGGATEKATE